MNEKAIAVIEKIIAQPERIKEIAHEGNEYYFVFDKYFFSIMKRDQAHAEFGQYSLYVYPGWTGSVAGLAQQFQDGSPHDIPLTFYSEKDYPSQAERKKFAELYALVKNKYLNVDKIFDDLLAS